MDTIAGRTVVVTGAARGIGYATAAALLHRGARVIIGDRDVEALERAVDGLAGAGPVSGHPLDVTDRASFASFLDKARADGGGRLDVLVNNAGVMPVGPFLSQSEAAIRSCLEVNVFGVLHGCQLVLPEMVARRSGHIVNIASLAGVLALPGQVVYAASKFGVVGLTTALADEFAPQGVQVSAVLPPFVETELTAGTRKSGATRAVAPEDIAAVVVRTLDKPKTAVSLPDPLRFVAALATNLAPRARRFVNRRLGLHEVFLHVDTDARRAYEARAQSSTGVAEKPA